MVIKMWQNFEWQSVLVSFTFPHNHLTGDYPPGSPTAGTQSGCQVAEQLAFSLSHSQRDLPSGIILMWLHFDYTDKRHVLSHLTNISCVK